MFQETTNADELDWLPGPYPGVKLKILRRDPVTGGVTGLCLLAESHLACHTFPEHQSICLNVFCCQPRPDWDFAGYLEREFGAGEVRVRRIDRPYTHERETRQLPKLRRAH